jgi:plastocyanin
MNVGTHQFVVSLDKIQTIEGYDTNYMWDTQSSDDLIFTFEITTWKFPNANNQLKFVYNDTHFYTGEEIKPELTVSVVDSLTQEELYQLVLDKDFEVAYANNISVTKKDSKAEIIVTFIGNFESEDNTLYFNILATEPTLLTIKEGKKVQFINAQYTDSGVTIYEDDTAKERTEDNKDNGFYLGHMVEMISVSDFIDYFANDKNKLLVFGKDIEYLKKENALTESDYSSNVGTGFTIVLYTDETHDIIADHIQVIIYGDIDGNGNINANDSLEALKMGGGSTIAKSAATGSTTSSVKIVDDVYYFAGMTVRTGKFFVNANDSLKILQNGTNKINADYYE